MVSDQKIKNLVKHYRENYSSDHWIKICREQKELKSAIKLAALCVDENGKKHPHQWRIPDISLRKLYNKLEVKIDSLKRVKTFDELFQIVNSIEVKSIGELTIYDVAQRIGENLKIYPDKVFIHRGTKIGAEYLIGKIKERAISIDRLPGVFKDCGVTCGEIEDILCLYKDRFKNSK